MRARPAPLTLLSCAALAATALAAPPASPPAADVLRFSDDYRAALVSGTTPLRLVRDVGALARQRGFRELDPLADPAGGPQKVAPGDRIYLARKGRAMVLATIGQSGLGGGLRIIGTHVDAPHLRILPSALGKSGDALILRAAAYGGIKDYQWDGLGLTLVGVVHKKGGGQVEVELGTAKDDFAFFVAPLAGASPPLTGGFGWKSRIYEVAAASIVPVKGGTGDRVRLRFLEELRRRYQVTEDDLRSAELDLVPRRAPRDVGFDRMILGASGHDDRACSFAAARAILDEPAGPPPAVTQVVYLSDREEIGSTGTTGAQSGFFLLATQALLRASGAAHDAGAVRAVLAKSEMLSGDVMIGVDPLFVGAHERGNAARLGRGPTYAKFTGYGGKLGGTEASSEMMARIARRLRKAGLAEPQYSTLGRVDAGGGGTIAQYFARHGVDVLDVGVVVLSMHAPFELLHKRDLFELYRLYRAFLSGP